MRDELSEINQQSAPILVSRQAQDPIVENRSAQTRPSQDEEQIYQVVEVLVTEDQYADFYDKHLGGTDKEKDIYEENNLLQV